eukprot:3784031-Rhodomonas_salina.1
MAVLMLASDTVPLLEMLRSMSSSPEVLPVTLCCATPDHALRAVPHDVSWAPASALRVHRAAHSTLQRSTPHPHSHNTLKTNRNCAVASVRARPWSRRACGSCEGSTWSRRSRPRCASRARGSAGSRPAPGNRACTRIAACRTRRRASSGTADRKRAPSRLRTERGRGDGGR